MWLSADMDRKQLVDAEDLLPLLFEADLLPTQASQPCLSPLQSSGRNAGSLRDLYGDSMHHVARPNVQAGRQERDDLDHPDHTVLFAFQHAPSHPVMNWLDLEDVQRMHVPGVSLNSVAVVAPDLLACMDPTGCAQHMRVD
jgi:hypothetical protein